MLMPAPIITHAAAATVAAALAGWAAWSWQGDRAAATLAAMKQQHATAQAELTERNAKHLVRVWARGDDLAASLASQQIHINALHQEHARAIHRLTTGRPCLSAELVGVLNRTDQPSPTDRPDPLPTPATEPAAADATAFATDADVSTWAATARSQYATCAARLDALIRWHER
jgi:hypothetical protein